MNLSHTRQINLGMLAFCAATSIPMSFFSFVLPAVLRQAGHSAKVVGLVSLVYLPYALRVLWAPAVDRVAGGRPSRFRAMAFGTLIAAIVGILGFLAVNPREDVGATIAIAIGVFACLATGLTAVDGYALVTLGAEGRKNVTAFQAAGFTLGGIVLGFEAVATDSLSWSVIVLLLAGTTAAIASLLLVLPRGGEVSGVANQMHLPRGVWRFLKTAAARRRMAVSLLAHGGLGLPLGYLPVLQIDSGLTAGQVGMFGAIGANLCGLAAAFAAGLALARFGGWRTVAGVAFAGAAVFGAAAACHAALDGPVFAVALSLMVMTLGYAFVVPYRGLVLTICHGERGATQAAVLSCLDVVLSIVSASCAGLVVGALGLTGLLTISSCACLAGALLGSRSVTRQDESILFEAVQVQA